MRVARAGLICLIVIFGSAAADAEPTSRGAAASSAGTTAKDSGGIAREAQGKAKTRTGWGRGWGHRWHHYRRHDYGSRNTFRPDASRGGPSVGPDPVRAGGRVDDLAEPSR